MSGPQPDLGAAVADLRLVAADLDGHIERRAAELAAPMITAALAQADQTCRAAAHAVQRRNDVIAEFRRLLVSKERQIDRLRAAGGGAEDG